MSNVKCQVCGDGFGDEEYMLGLCCGYQLIYIDTGLSVFDKKEKPFDITKHEWQGGHEIRSATVYDDVLELNLYITGDEFECYLARDDAIAIARHFKLTAEDLT